MLNPSFPNNIFIEMEGASSLTFLKMFNQDLMEGEAHQVTTLEGENGFKELVRDALR